MFSSARNIRSHSNRKGQAGGHRSSSSNATGVKSEVVKSVRVGKDTVPSGSDANTVHCSTGSPRVTPGTEGPKNPRMTRYGKQFMVRVIAVWFFLPVNTVPLLNFLLLKKYVALDSLVFSHSTTKADIAPP